MITSTQNTATIGKVLALAVLLAALGASLMLAAVPARASTTFYVNSTEDHADAVLTIGACDTGYDVTGAGGQQVDECTLRAAIEQANYTSGADTINFAIPGSGVKTFAPTSDLPSITEALTINGYSQPGAQVNTKAVGSDAVLKIEISGAKEPFYGDGLVISAANSTVKGLVINDFAYSGISLNSAAGGSKIEGNFIGTDASGTQDIGNYHGVSIYAAPNNIIGGTTAAARNVISGNGGEGVFINGSDATGNKVSGNYVGIDKTGIAPLSNSDGVRIIEAPNNTIGGTTAAARNVISGNDAYGVLIADTGASGNKVTGNYVGTDATGAKGLGNSDGVKIEEAPANTVGGTTAGARNVISGNDSEGVLIVGKGATGNKVVGNYVGTGASGQRVPGHNDSGVTIIDAINSVVGGTEAGARNIISGSSVGVAIAGDGATGNRVLSNSIFSNFGLGIDLGADGPTPNDPIDPDTGPNGLQNKPVLSSAKKGATGTTTVRGTLSSTPNKTFDIQFFSNPEGTDEGKTLLDSKSVSTNGTGNVSFIFSTRNAIRLGQNITATATGADGTSEFSAPRKVVTQ